MKTLIILLIAICAQTLGDVCLTRGMKSIGEVNTLDPGELFRVALQNFTAPYIWLGIFILTWRRQAAGSQLHIAHKQYTPQFIPRIQ
jgi:hypothetical protein